MFQLRCVGACLAIAAALAACAPDTPPADGAPATMARALCLAPWPSASASARALARAQADAVRFPDDVRPWLGLAGHWAQRARRERDPGLWLHVEDCVEAALAREPGHPVALQLRSQALLAQHRFAAARALAERLLAGDPEDTVALASLADAALELGDIDAATAATQRLMQLQPGMAGNSRAAWLRWLRGDVEGAKRLLRDALRDRDAREPEAAAWAFAETAALFWHQGDLDGAARLYREALRWQDEHPPALLGLARIALAQGDAPRAIGLLQRAQAAEATVAAAQALGDAHRLAGDEAAGRRQYDAAATLGRRGDRLALARLLATRDGDPQHALRLIAAERRSRDGVALDDIEAWALHRAGRQAEALAASDRARRLGTREAGLLYHAGAIRLALGREDEGRALLRDALALNPAFDPIDAPAARRLLQRAPGASAAGPGAAPATPRRAARGAVPRGEAVVARESGP